MEKSVGRKSFTTTLVITSLVLLVGGFVFGFIIGWGVYGAEMSNVGDFLLVTFFMLIGGGIGFIVAFLFIKLYGSIQKEVKFEAEDVQLLTDQNAILTELKAFLEEKTPEDSSQSTVSYPHTTEEQI